MNIAPSPLKVAFSEVTAQIIRANGRVERPRIVARYVSFRTRVAMTMRWLVPAVAVLLMIGAAHAAVGLFAATVIVDAGQAIVTNRMVGSGTEPKYIAWGTGAGTAAVANTTLFTEASEARTNGTSSRVTTTVTNDTYQVVGTITVAGADKTITNVGLFDASTSGNLFFKSDFTGLPLVVGDAIAWTIKVKFASA